METGSNATASATTQSLFSPTSRDLASFGDGIMSVIDFDMDIARKAVPKRDRVSLGMTGKFLP